MKDFAEAKFILGMQITRARKNGKLQIDQKRNIKDVFKRFNMEAVEAPIDVNQKH